jgi:hypothetical protein
MEAVCDNLLASARAYIEAGYRVVPVPTGQKGPRTRGWQQLRIDRDQVGEHFRPGMNIGLLLGEPSGWLVDVDLDCEEAIELAEDLLPATTCVTGRPGSPRSHRWYIAKGACTQQHRDPTDDSMMVELRSTGAQTLIGPSRHPDGEPYDMLVGQPVEVDAEELTQAVAQLARAILARRRPAPAPSPTALRDTPAPTTPNALLARAGAYLDALPPAISGQGGHAATYRAATSLVHGFAIDPETALDMLLVRFNPRCQPPWTEQELRHKVDDAATKQHTRPHGWLRDQAVASGVDLSGLSQADEQKPHDEMVDPGPFPEHLLEVPGFIKGVIDYNLATCQRQQPELALAGAIALQAVLAARKVCDLRGNRTNLYLIGIAPSGAGKDHARKVTKRILAQHATDTLEANEDIASDAGLVASLDPRPVGLFQFDEFGRFLRTVGDPRRAPWLYNVVSTLMKLYSSADQTFRGKAYADPDRCKVIHQPCAVVYATTVPEHFYESLTPESLADGFVARLLVFEGHGNTPRQRVPSMPPPDALMEHARWWGEFRPGGNLSSEHPNPLVIRSTPEADAVFDALAVIVDAQMQKGGVGRPMWARVEEKACRLALVYACSADRENPVIDEEAARWACDLAQFVTRRLLFQTAAWIAHGDFDQRQKRVLRVIKEAGGQLSASDLCRRTQWMSKRERQEVIDNLLETSQIRVHVEATTTRGRTVYEAC